MYEWILSILTWLAADPSEISREQPRAYAAVCVAMASLEKPAAPDDIEALTDKPATAK